MYNIHKEIDILIDNNKIQQYWENCAGNFASYGTLTKLEYYNI